MTSRPSWTPSLCTGLAAAVAALVGGCKTPPPPARVPASLDGPLTSSDVDAGRAVYENACAGCHEGVRGPDLDDRDFTPGQVRAQVRLGRGGMPAFTEAELLPKALEDVLAYLATRGTLRTPAAPGDAPLEDPAYPGAEPVNRRR